MLVHVNSSIPFSFELLVFSDYFKELITRLFAVASVEVMLQWNRSFWCADHIDLLLFSAAKKFKENIDNLSVTSI